jgi:hypothetical protein
MLADPSFAQAVQRVPAQGQEKQVMGPYFPISRYYVDRASFEKLGCVEARGSSPVAGAVCRDRTAPRSSIDHRPLRHADEDRRLRVRGRSSDFGCRGGAGRRSRGGRVRAVAVSVWRASHGSCRFVTGSGRLTAAQSCARRVWLSAALRGHASSPSRAWSLLLGRPLPVGHYRVQARARDTAGNLERPRHGPVAFSVT